MIGTPRHRGSPERGATIAEFALVAPILFFLLLIALDLGFMVLGNAVGSNAVRDGARVGILQFEDADTDGSTNNEAIKAAVRQRIVGLLKGTPVITVRCLDADTEATKDCDVDEIEFDRDLIEVELVWQHVALSPFVANATQTERVRMVINGLPDLDALPDPPPSVRFEPSDYTVNEPDGTVTLTVARVTGSGAFTVDYQTQAGSASTADFTSTSGTLSFAASDNSKAFTVPIVNDSLVESDEVFTVFLNNPTNGVIVLAPDAAVTIDSEDIAPPLSIQSARMSETGTPNGVVDIVTVTMSGTISSPGTWSATASPTGNNAVAVQSFSGNTLVLQLTGSTVNTADGAFAVSVSNICNTDGVCSSGSLDVEDRAGPVLISYGRGNGNGAPASGEVISFGFSEVIPTVPAGPYTVQLRNKVHPADSFNVLGILTGAVNTNSTEYLTGNPANQSADFAGTLAGVGTSTLQVTLGACTGSNNGCTSLGTAHPPGSVVAMTPNLGIRDAAGNVAAAAGTLFVPNPIF